MHGSGSSGQKGPERDSKNMKKKLFIVPLMALLVGARADCKEKNYNIQVDPLSLLSGSLYAYWDIQASPAVTVGPTLNIFDAEVLGTKVSVVGAGLRATYAFSGASFQDGWFVSGHGRYGRATVTEGSNEGKGNIFSLSTLMGYAWHYESGLNFNLGAGAIYFASPETVAADNGQDIEVSSFRGFLPSVDFTVGWAF